MTSAWRIKRIAFAISGLTLILSAFALFITNGMKAIRESSQTFDEAVHLAAGYSYWKTGDFRLNLEDPPLSKLIQAFPLLLLDLPFEPDPQLWQQADEWMIGKEFLYNSKLPASVLLTLARSANLFLGICLLLLMGWWIYRIGGAWILPYFIWLPSTDANLLAMSTQLTSDICITLFSTLSFYALWEYQRSYSPRWLFFLGIGLGLCLGSKFSVIFVIFALIATVYFRFWFAGVRFALPNSIHSNASQQASIREIFPALFRVFLIAALTVLPLYFFLHFPTWGQGLKQQFLRNSFEPPKYFFLGEVSSEGSWWYFPFVFLVKTPTGSLLLFLTLGLFSWRCRGKDSGVLLLPALLLFVQMMLTKVNLGVRVILPIYPLLYVYAGSVLSKVDVALVSLRFRCYLAASLLLLAGLNFGNLRDEQPSPLAYFNRFAGGWENGHRLLGDSNLDWGQDLGKLREWLKQHGNPKIFLSYAGTAPPSAFGIRYQLLPSWGYLEVSDDQVDQDFTFQWAVISITNLQGTYLKDRDTFAFLRDRKPTWIIGQTLWVFDLTEEPELLRQVRALKP